MITDSSLDSKLSLTTNNRPSDEVGKLAGADIDREFAKQREFMGRIRQQMAVATHQKHLLNIVTQQVKDLTEASRVLVYRFNSVTQGEVLAEAIDRGWTPTLTETLPATFFGAEFMEDYDTLGSVTIDYVASTKVTPYQLQLLEKFQVRSSIAVVIRLGGKVWGLLIAQQCNEARRWRSQEINLMEQIAPELALGLVSYDVQEQIKEQQVRDETVANVIDRIRRSLDIKTIFQTTTQEVRQLLKADRVGIYRFNPDWSGRFVAESVSGGWVSLMENPVEEALMRENSADCNLQLMDGRSGGRSDIKDTYLERTKGGRYSKGDKFRVVNDIYERKFPACYVELLEKFQARAYLTVGVYQGDKLWGLLATYQCSSPRFWEESEIRLVGQIADQLGVALQQAASLRQQRSQAEKLRQAVERERAISLVSDKIKQSQDTATIFKTATEEIRKLLKSDRVGIYRFNPDWSGEFVAESVGGGWLSLLNAQVDDPRLLENTKLNIDTDGCTIKQMRVRSLASQDTYLQRTKGGTYRQGEQFRVSNDIYKSGFPECYIQLLETFQAKAYINVPIFLGERLWGLMPCYQCSGPRKWEDEEIKLMVNLGGQLGIALQRAQDLEQLRQQKVKLEEAVERERAIAFVSDKIKQSQDTATIFKTATEEVRKLLKSDRVGIYRFNPDWSGEFVAESVGSGWLSLLNAQVDDPHLLENTKLNIDTDGCTVKQMRVRNLASQDTYLQRTKGGTYRQGEQFRVSNDIYKSGFPECYIQLLETFQAKAYINVPIFLGERLWGLMPCYQCSGARVWEDEEIKLMVNFGSQLGIALQRAQDLEQLRQQKVKLEEAVERERAIALVSDKIKQSQDTATIFKIVTEEIRKLLKSDRVGIYRFNPDWSGEFVAESVGGGWLSLLNAQVDDPRLLENTKLNINTDGCTIKQMRVRQLASQDTYLQRTKGGTYRQGEQFRVSNDIYQSGFPECYVQLLETFQAKAYINVPIFLGERLWGLMPCYQCSGARVWEDEEIKLMVSLGSQLGIALQRAQDLEQLRQQAKKLEEAVERERAIALISDKIKQSTDIKTIFRIATTEARKVFKSDRVGVYRFNDDWSGEFVAESVAPEWLPLLAAQFEDSRILEGTKANIDTEGCTIKQMQVRQLASQDTYLQKTQGGAYRQGELFRSTNDIYQSNFPSCYIDLLESFQAKAYITVPIFLGEKLWGLLANYQCSGARVWEDAESELMVQLGSQLGIALQRAEDLEKLRSQAEQLEISAKREKGARELLQRRALELLTSVRPALEGDLTVRAPLSEDELGTIADVYNNTLQSLRRIVIQVQKATERVQETSAGSDGQIRKLATQAREQSQELSQALAEVQKMVNSTQEVSSNADSIEKAVQNANSTVKSGESAMNRTVEGILAIRDIVAQASQKIRELSESSQKIDRVVNLIGDFATQTQLLSLNAAIEATRAGEYGKGFAVVADEVRSLARQSAAATSEISNLVSEIRNQTSEAIKVTEAAIAQVSAGTNLVEETKESLTAIAAATAEISQLVESITQATNAQLEQSKSVTQTMRAVADISANTTEESVQLSHSFQDSLATAQQLQEVVKQFKVN